MNELQHTAALLLQHREKRANLARIIGELGGKLGGSPAGWIPQGGPLMGSLAKGVLAGGLGYGLGRVAGNFMPGIDPHRLGVVSAIGGGLLPLALNRYKLGANFEEWRRDPTRRGKGPGYFFESMNRSLQSPPYNYYSEGPAQGLKKESSFRFGGNNTRDGHGIPVSHTIGMIRTDPLMSPVQKAQAISLIESAQPTGTGIVGWPTVTRAAVGAGVGFTAASLFGKALDTVFGGLSSPAQRKLQGAGTIAGILLNTGAIR